MTLLPPGVKVHLALGFTDMRKGIDGLAMLVQGVLRQDPFSGHLFVFRGRKASLIKIVFWDGTGLCLFTKRLEQGVFLCWVVGIGGLVLPLMSGATPPADMAWSPRERRKLLAYTLASLHNLHLIVNLVKEIRASIERGDYVEFRREWLAAYAAPTTESPARSAD